MKVSDCYFEKLDKMLENIENYSVTEIYFVFLNLGNLLETLNSSPNDDDHELADVIVRYMDEIRNKMKKD